MDTCFITAAVRTPIGNFGGGLSQIPAPGLAGHLIRVLVQRGSCSPTEIDQVILGNVLQASLGMNPARQAARDGGLPFSVPSYTVNMVCASGLYSILLADSAVRRGEARAAIAGGFENMSRAPRALLGTRWGDRLGHSQVCDLLVRDALWDPFYDCHMAETVERLVKKYGISREHQDGFSVESHRRAASRMLREDYYDEVAAFRSSEATVETDEHPRKDTSKEKLARLKPAFHPTGTLTAGNSSGINDGAAVVVLSADKPRRTQDLRAEIVYSNVIGVDPMDMGIAPAMAIRELLGKAGLRPGDVDLWEVNEAFAGQVLAVLREIDVPMERLNVNGGAIALGHPVGCSGARILVTLLHEMRARDAEHGVAALCVGGGLGVSCLVRAVR
jgi:acetyl-CoA C-acetyltransferase